MKIYHLYHSGVAIESQNKLLVFDYYIDKFDKNNMGLDEVNKINSDKIDSDNINSSDNISNDKRDGLEKDGLLQNSLVKGVIRKDILEKYDDVYVFVSHRHSDHYNPVIFEWEQYNPNIKYILSDDIIRENKRDNKNVYYMKKDEQISLDDISISAYGSTDQGLSFLLFYNGKTIFHAGDLNWWHWSSFSEEQLQQEEADFKKEVNKLKGKKIDIAFVPVDPRLKNYHYLAGEYFIETLRPSLFVPIHFGDEYNITEEFARRLSDYDTKIAIINRPGEKVY